LDITNFTKQQGEFLKADIVNQNQNALFEISGEAEIVHNEKYDTDRLHIPIKLGDNEYIFDCSKTNSRTISEALTNDTSKWVGKHLVLETYKTKTSDGKMVEAINVKEVK
jgi:hypothetical protein